jgi:hypothetical protein
MQTKQKRAATKIAAIMHASLEQFSEKEQEKRIKEIAGVKVKAGRKLSGKSAKPSSTRASRPLSRRASTAR